MQLYGTRNIGFRHWMTNSSWSGGLGKEELEQSESKEVPGLLLHMDNSFLICVTIIVILYILLALLGVCVTSYRIAKCLRKSEPPGSYCQLSGGKVDKGELVHV